MANDRAFDNLEFEDIDSLEDISIDFDELEISLQNEIDSELINIDVLEEEREIVGNPEKLGESVKNIIWEQFLNQVAVNAGDKFVEEDNNGMNLDLSKKAHYLTEENFETGEMPEHNTKYGNDYKERYDIWQKSFQRDENGNIKTEIDRRTGEEKYVLNKDAREDYDRDRPTGSKTVHKDHTISAAEIIRDKEAATFLDHKEKVEFANSEKNLVDLDAAANQSKSDSKMTDWLDSERDGQTPGERFNINEEELRERDKEAREEYQKVKDEGKKRAEQEGKESQRSEALKVGKRAAKAVLFQLLASFMREIVSGFVKWIMSKDKSPKSLLVSFKDSIVSFVKNLGRYLINAADVAITVIAEAIFGPVVRIIKRVWMLLKQGFRSLKESIKYLSNPANKGKGSDIKMMEIGKIVIAGLAVAGSLGLTQLLEMGLTALGVQIPALIFEIPVIGSIASIIAIFLGGLIAGIVGALILLAIDKAIEGRRKEDLDSQIIDKGNRIIQKQNELFTIRDQQMQSVRDENMKGLIVRHIEVDEQLEDLYSQVNSDSGIEEVDFNQIDNSLDDIWKRLSKI